MLVIVFSMPIPHFWMINRITMKLKILLDDNLKWVRYNEVSGLGKDIEGVNRHREKALGFHYFLRCYCVFPWHMVSSLYLRLHCKRLRVENDGP